MTKPADPELYKRVKERIYKEIPTHSAYRSGLLVQEYKRLGGKYVGTKPVTKGLTRWFKEDWRNQRGGVGYKKKGDIYRPTKRVNEKTPVTLQELSVGEIEKARREKAKTGRVNKFGK